MKNKSDKFKTFWQTMSVKCDTDRIKKLSWIILTLSEKSLKNDYLIS